MSEMGAETSTCRRSLAAEQPKKAFSIRCFSKETGRHRMAKAGSPSSGAERGLLRHFARS